MTKFLDSVWRVLISVRLTIVLLVLITMASVAGTLIGQQGMTQTPIEKLYTEETLRILVAFGLTDIFHSGIFISLILALALNLLSCSVERLPGVWRQAFKTPVSKVSDAALEWEDAHARAQKFLIHRNEKKLGKELEVETARLKAQLFMEKRFGGKYKLIEQTEKSFQIAFEHGKYSRLGVYITHLSLLLIMTGGVIGAVRGFEGGMSIEEGTRQDWIQHSKGSKLGRATYRENGIPVPNFLSLGFEVECAQFTLETYDGSRPKLFKSTLNFYENDVRVATREISVNNPTVYKGLTFYQASYSEVGLGSVDLKVYRAKDKSAARGPIKIDAEVDRAVSADVRGGIDHVEGMAKKAPSLSKTPLPAIESVDRVSGVRLNDVYRIDGDAAFKVVAVESNLMDLGPAARVQYFASRNAKAAQEFWIFKNLPGFDFSHRHVSKNFFVLEDVKPKYATGLSVARDPGANVVGLGSLILVAALFIALYTYQGRYWIVFKEGRGFELVAWSNKLFLIEPKFEKFVKEFTEQIS